MKFCPLCVFAAVLCFSCAAFEPKAAVLWTDLPEFAIYAEFFNARQTQYKVEIRYLASPAQELAKTQNYPDIVAGSWLKSSSIRTLFKPLDYLFKDKALDADAFYPRLLALGKTGNRQFLLPVSFNLPALVFSRNNSPMISNPFVISLEEIKFLGKAYNADINGVYSQMGFCFSPAWNDEFLLTAATLFDTSFREDSPLVWDSPALERTIRYIQRWIEEANTSTAAEDEFAFKYFYEPPPKLIRSGRLLFTWMESSGFFTLAEEERGELDFRWIAGDDRIPLSEDAVYYGICKDGKAKKAANAFTEWFFQTETQRRFLEAGRAYRINETFFGIGGGFSALREVTEQVFPRFYPGLLGHIPPAGFLAPPNILPQNWPGMKERVILPYLHKRIRSAGEDGGKDERSLEQQIADWARLNSKGP
jgi:hypothetical protein